MQKFTQKWSLVAMLEPVDEGAEFFWKDYPLHVTLASVFAVDWDSADLFDKLTALLANRKPIETTATEEARWGDRGQYHVMLLEKNAEIAKLHTDVHELLIKSGAVFNEPQFEADGYIPHSTIQKHTRLRKGDAVKVNSLTILDMFPGDDGYQRKILKTIKFS